MIALRTYRESDFEQVRGLWEQVFPDDPEWNRAPVAIPAKTAFQPDLLIVAEDQGAICGTVMAGYDGHRGWIYSLAVAPQNRGSGIGRKLVEEAEQRLRDIGCGKVNLQVRASNRTVIGFYQALGYQTEERVSMGKRIDTPSR
jgi:ribosomal protein S18 acetylase RimI-like enzyme